MSTVYAVVAPRNIRALYYAAEFGIRGASRLLAAERAAGVPDIAPVRTVSGSCARTLGLYARRAAASLARDRVLVMAAGQAGRLGQMLGWTVQCEVRRVERDAMKHLANVKPFAA